MILVKNDNFGSLYLIEITFGLHDAIDNLICNQLILSSLESFLMEFCF
jgi:hypothetical protein